MTKKQRKLQEALKIRKRLYLKEFVLEFDRDEMLEWPLSKIMDFLIKYRR